MDNQRRSSQQAFNLETLITKIATYTDRSGQLLIKKFDSEYLLSLLDRPKLCQIQKMYTQKSLDVTDFVRLILNCVDHCQQQTIYLSIASMDLFKIILQQSGGSRDKIQFQSLTDYICRWLLKEKVGEYAVKKKLLPGELRAMPQSGKKGTEINAPLIHGDTQECILKLLKNSSKKDRQRHIGPVKNGCFVGQLGWIFTLDSAGDGVSIFTTECRLVNKIVPTCSKIKRDVVVAGFVYSERQGRLGAVFKDFSLSFWDSADNFTFEKTFSISQYCDEFQTDIWFLEAHDLWVTTDSKGNLTTWDICSQRPIKQLTLQAKSRVNDLCQVSCLSLVALVQQSIIDQLSRKQYQQKILLYDLLKGCLIIQVDASRSRIHSLQFFSTYQVLLAAGCQNHIDVLQIDPVYLDTSLRGKMIGHQSMVVTFIAVERTPMVISCDDKQRIKIWDIRNFKCIQTVDMHGKSPITRLVDMIHVGKLGILGARLEVMDFDETGGAAEEMLRYQGQSLHAVRIEVEPAKGELLVFTNQDVRTYDLRTGTVKYVFSGLLEATDGVACCRYIHSKHAFILGTHKGKINIYSQTSGHLLSQLCSHLSDVPQVCYDPINNLFVSASSDSAIIVQRQSKSGTFEKIRTFKDNFSKKQIHLMDLSLHHNIIVVGNNRQSSVFFWDYIFAKLLAEVRFEVGIEPTAFSFINGYGTIVIADTCGRLTGLKFTREENSLQFTTLFQVETHHQLNHLIVDTKVSNSFRLESCEIFAASVTGKVYTFDLTECMRGLDFEQHVKKKGNYHGQRQVNQSFINQLNKQTHSIHHLTRSSSTPPHPALPHTCFQAHKKSITCLTLLHLEQRYLITSSTDRRVKIFLNGSLLCDLNINLPLPFKWDLKIQEQRRDKIALAIGLLSRILNRYKETISVRESGLLRIDNFCSMLEKDTVMLLTQPKLKKTSLKADLFQQKFNSRDILQSKMRSKKITHRPTLKQMQIDKRTKITIQNSTQKDKQDQNTLTTSHNQKACDRKQLMQFLHMAKDDGYLTHQIEKELPGYNFLTEVKWQPAQELSAEFQRVMSPPSGLSSRNKQGLPTSRIRLRKSRNFVSFQSYFHETQQQTNHRTEASDLCQREKEKERQKSPPANKLSIRRRKKFVDVLNQINRRASKAKIPRYTEMNQDETLKDFSQFTIKTLKRNTTSCGFRTMRL